MASIPIGTVVRSRRNRVTAHSVYRVELLLLQMLLQKGESQLAVELVSPLKFLEHETASALTVSFLAERARRPGAFDRDQRISCAGLNLQGTRRDSRKQLGTRQGSACCLRL